MEEKNEARAGVNVIPEAKDKMTQADADKVRALVKLDIAKFRVQRERFLASVAQCDLAIAQQEEVLADLERRVVGVDYPEPPEKSDKPAGETPVMGEPVGGEGK